MATGKVNVTVLDVGQGQSTFVEIYDDSIPAKLIATQLFDLGSVEKVKSLAGINSVTYIADKLKSMAVPTIDLLVLSHKDSDHVNLIKDLLKLFPTLDDLGIDKVYYSGSANWYPKGLLDEITKYVLNGDEDVCSLPVNASSYNGTTKETTALYNENEVIVLLMVANTPVSGKTDLPKGSKPDSNVANTVSVVCLVKYMERYYLINGDATFETLCNVVRIFHEVAVPSMAMLTMPHHGSRLTTFGLGSSTAEILDNQRKSVEAYVDMFKARSLTVSADRKHNHPSMETIVQFSKYVSKDTPWYVDPDNTLRPLNLHSMNSYMDILMTNPDTSPATEITDYSFQTQANIYSTLYSLGIDDTEFSYSVFSLTTTEVTPLNLKAPFPLLPEGVSWCYSMTPTVDALLRLDNRGPITTDTLSVAPSLSMTAARLESIPSDSIFSGFSPKTQTVNAEPALTVQNRSVQPPPSIHAPVRSGLASKAPALGRLKTLR